MKNTKIIFIMILAVMLGGVTMEGKTPVKKKRAVRLVKLLKSTAFATLQKQQLLTKLEMTM